MLRGALVVVVALVAGAALRVIDGEHSASAAGSSYESPAGARALTVAQVAPASSAQAAPPRGPFEVRFSAPLAPGTTMPTITPSVPGTWHRHGTDLSFVPDYPLLPLSQFTMTIPGGAGGFGDLQSASGGSLPQSVQLTWTIENGSVLRIQQLLAKWGYLPLTFTPAKALPNVTGARLESLYHPQPGTFAWRYPDTPSVVRSAWKEGVANHMTRGAIVAFERTHELPAYTSIRAPLWPALVAAEGVGTTDPQGYTAAIASKVMPETLTIWHNGQIVFHSLANTGIAQSPTPDGDFFVYLRHRSQTMRGHNPDGQYYVDHGVKWINYFDGNDAIHGFVRASYGFPQSVGCVELPVPEAAIAWGLLHYGTLVVVTTQPAPVA